MGIGFMITLLLLCALLGWIARQTLSPAPNQSDMEEPEADEHHSEAM